MNHKKSLLIGGLIGLIYFVITYSIDIGACRFNSSYCSGATGLVTLILNAPSVLLAQIAGLGGFWVIAILDFILGSLIGFLIATIYRKIRKMVVS